MFQPSLVEHENVQLITHESTKVAIEANMEKANKMILMNIDEFMAAGAAEELDILDVLMPPRIVEDSGKFWYQNVSRAAASSSDLAHLQQRVDGELTRLGAREMGLCEIRRKVYDQLFEELTRQEIIDCPERGRLLRMIRREAELSMKSILNGYESVMAYGIKKKLGSFAEKNKLTIAVTKLLSKISDYNDVIQDLERKLVEVKKTTEANELEKDKEFCAVEEKIRKENRSDMLQLIGLINASIEDEDQ